jgi:hypothetical protein
VPGTLKLAPRSDWATAPATIRGLAPFHTPADRAGETERATPDTTHLPSPAGPTASCEQSQVSVYRSGRRVGPADPAVPTASPFSRPRGLVAPSSSTRSAQDTGLVHSELAPVTDMGNRVSN